MLYSFMNGTSNVSVSINTICTPAAVLSKPVSFHTVLKFVHRVRASHSVSTTVTISADLIMENLHAFWLQLNVVCVCMQVTW